MEIEMFGLEPKRYQAWMWRPGGRRERKWKAARIWAEALNEKINELPQHEQDQLDAQLRNKVIGQ